MKYFLFILLVVCSSVKGQKKGTFAVARSEGSFAVYDNRGVLIDSGSGEHMWVWNKKKVPQTGICLDTAVCKDQWGKLLQIVVFNGGDIILSVNKYDRKGTAVFMDVSFDKKYKNK